MGIQGLLPMVKPICRSVHVKEYSGKRMAVDGYVWLHRGAYACAKEIVQRIRTEKFINYGLSMAKMLHYYNITPVLVFDGARLPAKSGKEHERHERRRKAKSRAVRLQNEGNLGEAHEAYKKAVDITPALAHQLITKLREEQFECIVAPYEADAQLAYLVRSGYVDGIITEDSDLIPYGATCVLFKLEKNGYAIEYKQSFLVQSKEYDFFRMTPNDIIRMCILSGCDYLDSLQGIGIKKAYKLIRDHVTIDRILAFLSRQQVTIPEEYQIEFEKAYLTFKYQTVWDPIEEILRPLEMGLEEEIHHQGNDLSFLGTIKDPAIAKDIAHCIIDPTSHEPFNTAQKRIPTRSRARTTFSIETPTQTNKITSYVSSKASIPIPSNAPAAATVKSPIVSPNIHHHARGSKKKKKLFKSRFFSTVSTARVISPPQTNTTNTMDKATIEEDTTPNMFESLSYQHHAIKTPTDPPQQDDSQSSNRSYASQDLLEIISDSRPSAYVRKRQPKRSLFEYFSESTSATKIKRTNKSRFFTSQKKAPQPPSAKTKKQEEDIIVID